MEGAEEREHTRRMGGKCWEWGHFGAQETWLCLVRWAQGSHFYGNFLNPAAPPYSLKAFNFHPRNRVGQHRRTGAVPIQPEFPSELFGMV